MSPETFVYIAWGIIALVTAYIIVGEVRKNRRNARARSMAAHPAGKGR